MHGDRRRWFDDGDDARWLPMLRQAALDGRRIRVSYRSISRDEPATRILDPVGVVDSSGHWYLVAERDGQARSYRVSRLVEVEVLDEPRVLHDPRPLAERWQELRGRFEALGSYREVTLTVDPQAAPDLRRILSLQVAAGTRLQPAAHPQAPDGWPVWRASLRNHRSTVGLALAWAPTLRVLEPADLLVEIQTALHQAAACYPVASSGSGDRPGEVRE